MRYITLSCTSSPCNLLFLNLGVYSFVQAIVGVGTVLIWYFAVAYTTGGGGGGVHTLLGPKPTPPLSPFYSFPGGGSKKLRF